MIYENILDLIGNTPVVKLNFLNGENIADIYLIGKEEDILSLAKENNISLEGCKIIEPVKFADFDLCRLGVTHGVTAGQRILCFSSRALG